MELHLELTGSMVVPKSTWNHSLLLLDHHFSVALLWDLWRGIALWEMISKFSFQSVWIFLCTVTKQDCFVFFGSGIGNAWEEAWCPSQEGGCGNCSCIAVTTRQLTPAFSLLGTVVIGSCFLEYKGFTISLKEATCQQSCFWFPHFLPSGCEDIYLSVLLLWSRKCFLAELSAFPLYTRTLWSIQYVLNTLERLEHEFWTQISIPLLRPSFLLEASSFLLQATALTVLMGNTSKHHQDQKPDHGSCRSMNVQTFTVSIKARQQWFHVYIFLTL